jgi:C4-dicarboxylate-specific signal transduction histidine kinase
MLGKPVAVALGSMLKRDPASVMPHLIGALSEAIKLNKTRFRAKESFNDSERLLAGEITPLYQSESHFLVDLRDITEDEQAVLMEARRERLATIGNLAVGVAHEIQNPNTFSRVNASNLRTLFQAMRPIVETGLKHSPGIKLGTLTPEKMFSRIDEAVNGVEMASRRIEAVLGTLKSFGRTPTEQNAEADPIKAVREAHLLTTHVASGKAELCVELPESLPAVHGGVAELSQVFVNLIQNAILAFDLPGEQLRGNGPACVKVYLENETENEIVMAVSDNGPGIEAAHQSKIFRPYFTTRAQGEGTGLGLSISSDILHRYGGDLTVRSRPADGATFLVTLRKASSKLSTLTEGK